MTARSAVTAVPGLRVRGVEVADARGRRIVGPLDVDVPAGRVVAVVGESGSGKTSAVLAALDALPPGLRRTGGTTLWNGNPVVPGRAARRWRSTSVGLLGQDPAADLHPLRTVAGLVAEGCPALRGPARDRAVARALDDLGLDPGLLRRRPHELSGGQAQRVALARAVVGAPPLLVLDEPTSGLDTATVALVAALLERRRADPGAAALVVSHDRSFVERIADDVVVVGGRPARRPAPLPAGRRTGSGRRVVLAARDLALSVPGGGRVLLDGVELEVGRGEFVAVLGPSGCGKSTLLRALAGLHRPRRGTVEVDGRPVPPTVEGRGRALLRAVQFVGQDPVSALNPAHRVGAALARPARLLRGMSAAEAAATAADLLDAVGLAPELAHRRPDRLSGGQRQRVAVARALAADPDVLLADEVTSALDAETAQGLLDLLDRLRAARGTALVVATHDRAVAARADRVLVVDPEGRGLVPEGRPRPLREPG
ncbi:ABC transporter ATP-binding protein [Thermobifida halotolerans]|uniref:ABC transporter ATP-binding protein n=1 Tax=Thermobifida halotolerans TaxID=483545 RepID=A0AA97LZ80_9ACTN|nr:ATP-binding cassette domain-containing protein [Thermobifida halotolerans]UOE20664.1 ABC transporter ATP-binding protein [Thermobifida halotolerans]